MTTAQEKQAQLKADAKAKAEERRTVATAKFDAVIAAIKAEVADLNPTDIAAGFRVGGVEVEKGYSPYSYFGDSRVPDRITVCYTERKGQWRTKRKTLTYTVLDILRIAERVRNAVESVASGQATRERIEREEAATRRDEETRLAPVQALVGAFTEAVGEAALDYDVAVENHHTKRFRTRLLLSADEVALVLQTLAKGGGK